MRLAFMDPLVLAIADGTKTVTRRMTAPRCKPGDVIEVCEALVPRGDGMGYECVAYRADGVLYRNAGPPRSNLAWPWKVRVLPARYCPTWAVRHRRVVADVRPEILPVIDDADAMREGIVRLCMDPSGGFFRIKRRGEPDIVTASPRRAFLAAFRNLHNLADDADPVVFRIEFRSEA